MTIKGARHSIPSSFCFCNKENLRFLFLGPNPPESARSNNIKQKAEIYPLF